MIWVFCWGPAVGVLWPGTGLRSEEVIKIDRRLAFLAFYTAYANEYLPKMQRDAADYPGLLHIFRSFTAFPRPRNW